MKNKKAVQLSLAVYRVTNLFPQGEALTYQIRELTNQIVADLTAKQKKQAAVKIKILLQYFSLAKVQSWTKELNFKILSKEYKDLLHELVPQKPVIKRKKREVVIKEVKPQTSKRASVNKRQEDILRDFKGCKAFGINDLVKAFPKVSRRTLNRDLGHLCLANCLTKNGRGKKVVYEVIKL